MRLLLIRHGETTSNLNGALDTAVPGAALTRRGVAQVSALGAALRTEGLVAVYTSPLLRARTTADALAKPLGLEVRQHPGLAEIGAGDLEMRSDKRATLRYVEYMLKWMEGDVTVQIPGGITGETFLASYTAALTLIASEQKGRGPVAVITHGASMRVFLAVRAGFGVRDAARMWVENTGMASVEFNAPDQWTLTQWHPEPIGGIHLQHWGGEAEAVPPAAPSAPVQLGAALSVSEDRGARPPGEAVSSREVWVPPILKP